MNILHPLMRLVFGHHQLPNSMDIPIDISLGLHPPTVHALQTPDQRRLERFQAGARSARRALHAHRQRTDAHPSHDPYLVTVVTGLVHSAFNRSVLLSLPTVSTPTRLFSVSTASSTSPACVAVCSRQPLTHQMHCVSITRIRAEQRGPVEFKEHLHCIQRF